MEVKETGRSVEITFDELQKFIEEKTGKSFANYILDDVYDSGEHSIMFEFNLD